MHTQLPLPTHPFYTAASAAPLARILWSNTSIVVPSRNQKHLCSEYHHLVSWSHQQQLAASNEPHSWNHKTI